MGEFVLCRVVVATCKVRECRFSSSVLPLGDGWTFNSQGFRPLTNHAERNKRHTVEYLSKCTLRMISRFDIIILTRVTLYSIPRISTHLRMIQCTYDLDLNGDD